LTIYQLAFSLGEFKYLGPAHRASQFNLQHINEEGYFSLKANKYEMQDKQVDIYINATLVESEQLMGGNIAWPFNSNKKLTFAKAMNHPDMYSSNYRGFLDDIAIWNSALSNDDIKQIFETTPQDERQHLTLAAQDNAGNFFWGGRVCILLLILASISVL
jgi:hypothetical protein